MTVPNNTAKSRLCVVTVTFYPDTTDIRYKLALDLCRQAAKNEINVIVVDGTPNDDVRKQLSEAGAGYVHVFVQDRERFAGKGGALRQSIQEAKLWLANTSDEHGNSASSLKNCAICYTEPEKVDLINHKRTIAKPILDGDTEVVVPFRNTEMFRKTYPIEQYHSESFANLHFDSLANQCPGFQSQQQRRIDWLFGPFAFRADLANTWLDYPGNSWDAQMVPYVRGVRNENWRIMSVEVTFRHPREMKEQEEGDPVWTGKRLHQLNLLFDLLGKAELSSES